MLLKSVAALHQGTPGQMTWLLEDPPGGPGSALPTALIRQWRKCITFQSLTNLFNFHHSTCAEGCQCKSVRSLRTGEPFAASRTPGDRTWIFWPQNDPASLLRRHWINFNRENGARVYTYRSSLRHTSQMVVSLNVAIVKLCNEFWACDGTVLFLSQPQTTLVHSHHKSDINQSIKHEFLTWPKYLRHCWLYYTVCRHKLSDKPNHHHHKHF